MTEQYVVAAEVEDRVEWWEFPTVKRSDGWVTGYREDGRALHFPIGRVRLVEEPPEDATPGGEVA